MAVPARHRLRGEALVLGGRLTDLGGAHAAALFLQHFVGDRPWAHLDVASAGDAPAESYEWTTGPTGFGARALLAWLGSDDPLAGLS